MGIRVASGFKALIKPLTVLLVLGRLTSKIVPKDVHSKGLVLLKDFSPMRIPGGLVTVWSKLRKEPKHKSDQSFVSKDMRCDSVSSMHQDLVKNKMVAEDKALGTLRFAELFINAVSGNPREEEVDTRSNFNELKEALVCSADNTPERNNALLGKVRAYLNSCSDHKQAVESMEAFINAVPDKQLDLKEKILRLGGEIVDFAYKSLLDTIDKSVKSFDGYKQRYPTLQEANNLFGPLLEKFPARLVSRAFILELLGHNAWGVSPNAIGYLFSMLGLEDRLAARQLVDSILEKKLDETNPDLYAWCYLEYELSQKGTGETLIDSLDCNETDNKNIFDRLIAAGAVRSDHFFSVAVLRKEIEDWLLAGQPKALGPGSASRVQVLMEKLTGTHELDQLKKKHDDFFKTQDVSYNFYQFW